MGEYKNNYDCSTCKDTDRCESCMKEYRELIDLGIIVPEKEENNNENK